MGITKKSEPVQIFGAWLPEFWRNADILSPFPLGGRRVATPPAMGSQLWHFTCRALEKDNHSYERFVVSSHCPNTVRVTHRDRVVMSADSLGQHHGEEIVPGSPETEKESGTSTACNDECRFECFSQKALGSLPRKGSTRPLCWGSSGSQTWRSTFTSETNPWARGDRSRGLAAEGKITWAC